MLYGAINVAEMRKEWCRRRRRRCARWLPHSPSRHRRRRANEGGREGGEEPLGRGRKNDASYCGAASAPRNHRTRLFIAHCLTDRATIRAGGKTGTATELAVTRR